MIFCASSHYQPKAQEIDDSTVNNGGFFNGLTLLDLHEKIFGEDAHILTGPVVLGLTAIGICALLMCTCLSWCGMCGCFRFGPCGKGQCCSRRRRRSSESDEMITIGSDKIKNLSKKCESLEEELKTIKQLDVEATGSEKGIKTLSEKCDAVEASEKEFTSLSKKCEELEEEMKKIKVTAELDKVKYERELNIKVSEVRMQAENENARKAADAEKERYEKEMRKKVRQVQEEMAMEAKCIIKPSPYMNISECLPPKLGSKRSAPPPPLPPKVSAVQPKSIDRVQQEIEQQIECAQNLTPSSLELEKSTPPPLPMKENQSLVEASAPTLDDLSSPAATQPSYDELAKTVTMLTKEENITVQKKEAPPSYDELAKVVMSLEKKINQEEDKMEVAIVPVPKIGQQPSWDYSDNSQMQQQSWDYSDNSQMQQQSWDYSDTSGIPTQQPSWDYSNNSGLPMVDTEARETPNATSTPNNSSTFSRQQRGNRSGRARNNKTKNGKRTSHSRSRDQPIMEQLKKIQTAIEKIET